MSVKGYRGTRRSASSVRKSLQVHHVAAHWILGQLASRCCFRVFRYLVSMRIANRISGGFPSFPQLSEASKKRGCRRREVYTLTGKGKGSDLPRSIIHWGRPGAYPA